MENPWAHSEVKWDTYDETKQSRSDWCLDEWLPRKLTYATLSYVMDMSKVVHEHEWVVEPLSVLDYGSAQEYAE